MSTTVTDGSTTLNPILRLDRSNVYETRNKVHELLAGGVAVTFGGQPLRSGTLSLLFASETAAQACLQMHLNGYVMQVADTSAPSLNMTYVVSGNLGAEKVEDTTDAWLVNVDVQEVQP